MKLSEVRENQGERIVEDLSVMKSQTAKEAFSSARDFLEQLREKYPDHHFPPGALMEAFNPEYSAKTAISYIARVGDEGVAMLMGTGDQLSFNAQGLIVDPKFRNTNVPRQLIEKAQSDFENIRFIPDILDRKERPILDSKATRIGALIRFYKKFGFVENGTGSMVWSRRKENI